METRFMRKLPTFVKNEDSKSDLTENQLRSMASGVDASYRPHILACGAGGSGKTVIMLDRASK